MHKHKITMASCCKACSSGSKIGRTMRNKSKVDTNSVNFILGTAIGGATGGIVGAQLEKIEFIAANPEMSGTIIGAIKAGAGYYLFAKMKQGGDIVKGVGVGWLVDGAATLVSGFIDNSVSGLSRNTLGTGSLARHNRSHRVLGGPGYQATPQPMYRQAAI